MKGTPTLQSTQSNYTIFGSNSSTGKIVSTPISIKVNSQQVRITPSSLSETGMVVNTALTPVTFVATEPIVVSRLGFSWTWDILPDGIGFYDMNGTPILYGYSGSNSIQLLGTPTLAAATSFANANLTTYSARLTGTQQQGGGVNVSGSSLITFSFTETVLYSAVTIPALYATEDLGYKNVKFTAATYFASGSPITSIVAQSLPAGLSLSSLVSSGGRYSVTLTGTPSVVDQVGTAYTFIATNANGVTRTQSFVIPILPDIVSFTTSPTENTTYSYIVSKQIDPITFTAVSSANKSITTWALSLSSTGYGLYLSATSGSTVTLYGTPTNPLVQTSVTITATDSLGTSVVRTVLITIANDTFGWPTYTPTFIQNKPIDSYQFHVTTTSGRQIQSFSATGLPAGIVLSPAGILSGTPTASTSPVDFIVSATTGYVSPPTGSSTFRAIIIPDNILTVLTTSPTTIPFTGTSFSVANFAAAFSYSGFTSSNSVVTGSILPLQIPAPTFSIVNNVFSGTIPLYQAPQYTFQLNARLGSVSTSVTALLTLSNTPTPYRRLFGLNTTMSIYDSFAYTPSGFSTAANTGVSSSTPSGQNVWTSIAVGNPASSMFGTVYYPSGLYLYIYNADSDSLVPQQSISSPTHQEYIPPNPPKPGRYVTVEDYLDFTIYGNFQCIAGDSTAGKWVALGSFSNVSSSKITTAFSSVYTGSTWVNTFQDPPDGLFTLLYGKSPLLYYVSGSYYLTLNATTLDAAGGYSSVYSFTHPSGTITPVSTTLPTYFIPSSVVHNSTTSETFIVGSMSSYSTGGASGQTPPTAISNFYRGSGTSWTEVANPLSTISTTDYTSGIFDIKQAIWGSMSNVVICGRTSAGAPKICYSTDGLVTWTSITPAGSTIYRKICFDTNSWSFSGGGKLVFYDTALASPSTQVNTSISGTLIGYVPRPQVSSSALSGTLTIPTTAGSLIFTEPTTSLYALYQYCPMPTIPFRVTGGSGYIYYYSISSNLPVGMTFTTETTGSFSTLTGIPANYTANPVSVTVYAANGTNISFTNVNFRILTPSFTSPQVGAGAFTSMLRSDVEGNAAQNARDNRVFPQVDPLAGPLMAPRAPDVTTMSNCFLGLCKKPCPTCHTML